MEHIYIFPIEDISSYNIIKNSSRLTHQPFGLCCQYNMNKDGYGPYGFVSKTSITIANQLIKHSIWFNDTKNEFRVNSNFLKSGFNLYGLDNAVATKINSQLNKYCLEIKKNTLYARYNKKYNSPIEKPLLLDLFQADMDAAIINKIIDNNFNVAYNSISNFIVILFSKSIEKDVIKFKENFSDIITFLKSERQLKDW